MSMSELVVTIRDLTEGTIVKCKFGFSRVSVDDSGRKYYRYISCDVNDIIDAFYPDEVKEVADC